MTSIGYDKRTLVVVIKHALIANTCGANLTVGVTKTAHQSADVRVPREQGTVGFAEELDDGAWPFGSPACRSFREPYSETATPRG